MAKIDSNVLETMMSYVDDGLRDYQQHNKKVIYQKWCTTNSVLLQMPTGTGKTRLFVSLINDLKHYGETHCERFNILIITHRKELVEQIIGELKNHYNIDCSLITPEDPHSHLNPKPVCVASIQTLSRRLEKWNDYRFDVVIIDEAHHVKGTTYRRALKAFKGSKVLGVTATPYRMNGVGLAREFDELIVSPPIKNFIEAGWLSNYDYYSIEDHNELYQGLEQVPLDVYGDFRVTELWRFCGKDKIRAHIVGSYLKYAKGKKGIVYTINQAHNHQLCEEFQICGIRAYGIDSETDAETRANIVERFRRGEIDVLCNVNIFTEGFDCPDVEFIQLARPTKSLGLYLQQVGRGLRIAPGKRKVLFLDNVGLHNRFGFPSSKRQWGKHFVGYETTEERERYAKQIDEEEPFAFSKRNQDLSEGCEEITLIESTGINEIIEKEKEKYVAGFAEELKPIVENIFATNYQFYNEYIENYYEEHLVFHGEYKEDLLNPCSLYSMKYETDNEEYLTEKIKKEFKPIANFYSIEYEEYKGWQDYAQTRMNMAHFRFKKFLHKANMENMAKLNSFTVGQLHAFFEMYYGNKHNMTQKLHVFCKRQTNDPKWWEVKSNPELCGYER